jgi:hypothetical protein
MSKALTSIGSVSLLYKGLAPFLIGDGLSGAVKFSVFELLDRRLSRFLPARCRAASSYISAAVAFLVASVILVPAESLKALTQLQVSHQLALLCAHFLVLLAHVDTGQRRPAHHGRRGTWLARAGGASALSVRRVPEHARARRAVQRAGAWRLPHHAGRAATQGAFAGSGAQWQRTVATELACGSDRRGGGGGADSAHGPGAHSSVRGKQRGPACSQGDRTVRGSQVPLRRSICMPRTWYDLSSPCLVTGAASCGRAGCERCSPGARRACAGSCPSRWSILAPMRQLSRQYCVGIRKIVLKAVKDYVHQLPIVDLFALSGMLLL